ncbi:MAG: hypothetical protein AAF485_16090 [Chloroflexota bacterium]
MINHSHPTPSHLSWSSLMWRIVLTGLILLLLTASITLFSNLTALPEDQSIPAFDTKLRLQ